MFRRIVSRAMRGALLAPPILLLLGALAAPTPSAAAQLREVGERVLPFQPDGDFSIDSQNGRITVETWDRPEARIQITREVRAADEKRARALMEELRADVTVGSDRIAVKSHYPKTLERYGILDVIGQRVKSMNIHYYVQLPSRANLNVKTANGEIRVRGVRGEVVAHTTNGAIDVRSVEGPVQVGTTNGAIRLLAIEGSARATTTNGAIAAQLRRVDPSRRVTLTTTNGDVTASFPADLKARIDATTTNGRVRVGFPWQRFSGSGQRSVRGTIGGGGAEVVLRTTNGNIVIQKAGDAGRS